MDVCCCGCVKTRIQNKIRNNNELHIVKMVNFVDFFFFFVFHAFRSPVTVSSLSHHFDRVKHWTLNIEHTCLPFRFVEHHRHKMRCCLWMNYHNKSSFWLYKFRLMFNGHVIMTMLRGSFMLVESERLHLH